MGRNKFALFCVLLYTDYKPHLHKEFEVASTYDKHAKYDFWSFHYNLFCSYTDNIHTHTYRPTNKNVSFGLRVTSKFINSSKCLF